LAAQRLAPIQPFLAVSMIHCDTNMALMYSSTWTPGPRLELYSVMKYLTWPR
jgi:hypothetical protein